MNGQVVGNVPGAGMAAGADTAALNGMKDAGAEDRKNTKAA